MKNTMINITMDRIESLTDMMVIHSNNGDMDLVRLLDREIRDLTSTLDSGSNILTLSL